MKLRALALCILALALALPTFAATPMKPGKWQVTIEMDMPNMPMKMPPTTVTHCVTKEQAENPQPPKKKDDACQVSDYKINGNTVTWTVKCTGEQEMTGEGKMVFDGDSYEGTTHIKTSDMEMTQKFTGKYLGACDEK